MDVLYKVKMPKQLDRTIREMPRNSQKVLLRLVDDIQERGPEQPAYHNYSKLGEYTYHCHLAYRWVACWRCDPDKVVNDDVSGKKEPEQKILVEVEYVGSREKAPY
jgi:hypothetical protein